MFVRLWSLHPSYLDAKGLVALWREGLLARLPGKTAVRPHPLFVVRDGPTEPWERGADG